MLLLRARSLHERLVRDVRRIRASELRVRSPAAVRGDPSRGVRPGSFRRELLSELKQPRLRLRGAVEVDPGDVVLHGQRAGHDLPRGALVEVERRDGVGIALALGGLREALEPPPALLGAAVHAFERGGRPEDVRDEPPVAAKLVNDGAQELVLDGGPRPRHARGAASLLLLRLLLVQILLPLLPAARPLEVRQGHVVLLVRVRLHSRLLLRLRDANLLPARADDVLRLSLFAVLVHPRRRRLRRALRREGRLRRAPTLVRDAQRLGLGRSSRSLHDGARATALALLPVPQPPLVVGKLESLRVDDVHPPLLRVRRVAVVQQRGKFLDDGWCSGRDGVEVELRVEDGVGHTAGEVDGRGRGHRGGGGFDAILLAVAVGILLLLVVLLLVVVVVGFLLVVVGSLAAATTARGRRGGGLLASLGGGLAAPLLPALLGSVLLVLLVLNRLLDDRLLQSRDVPDEFHHRPLLDHAHPRRGRGGLGEDALRPNRRRLRRRDCGGVGGVRGLRLVAVGIHRGRAVRGLSLVRVRLDGRLRRFGFLSFGRRGGGLRGGCRGGGGATRSARLGFFRLGFFRLLLPLLGALSLGTLLVVVSRLGHQLRGGRDGLLHRAPPRLLPEVSNLPGDSRARLPTRLLERVVAAS
mmetsp:Transcript_10045/g.41438  ORF Transcript_10045/g.41438 Transcript_10045/m.41438 type:complete len:640 (+) Transcript_10045:2691-4610(+)